MINQATKGNLNSKQLTKWILKKQRENAVGKLVCAVAAKLLQLSEQSLSAVNHTTQK